ncbi:MAG: hypothetical protein AVDCRST_MAG96-4247 [uncultured Segetibacter sp.]|uniref:Uncharacterized protein n=1 Tax=uncultured Segetibacter sp. TaxID=481133 RepID=A0A6J4U7A3_9BACT|nr:MAG: hypothetical protein AVDCRST_MAG96-4247 [uncultured Segetibacter sp.]
MVKDGGNPKSYNQALRAYMLVRSTRLSPFAMRSQAAHTAGAALQKRSFCKQGHQCQV